MPDPIRIFLSSPGDLNAERRAAEAIIESLRRDPLLRGRHLEIVSWDSPTSHLPMLAQYTPQQIVDMGLPRPSQCDVVLVMFWSRMGTPLDEKKFGLKDDGSPYWSGTEWEYLDAIRRADAEGTPAVLLYRRMDKVLFDADDAEISKKQAQYQRVKDFFAALHDPTSGAFRRSYNTYTGEDGFKTLFEKDLRALVGSLLSGAASARTLLPPSEPEPYTGDPYPGLLALTPAQAGIFFGRGEETQRLIDRLRGSRFVGVVGASGSGKSSLVGAGMIPKLRNGAIDGSQTWLLPDYDLKTESWMGARFTPTTDPFTALASRIARLVKTKEDHLAAELAHTPESPAPLLAPLFEGRPASCELLLFIDQFEELMTLSLESRQKPFARLLAALAEHPRVRTVVTLRADFLDHCLNMEPLQPLLREPITVGPPSPIALAQMVEGPARKTGLHFDPPSLPERIVVDVGNEKGGLALLAYALSQLYAGRKNNHLTEVVYDSFGGVQKAIGTKAQAVYDALDPVAQAALTPLFGQLVTVTRDGEPTRRRMSLDSLLIGAGENRLLQRLIDERLLVSDEGTVEVAHEALFRHWPALVEWIATYRGHLYLLDETRHKALEWWNTPGRPVHLMLRHEDEKKVWIAAKALHRSFTDIELAFLRPELERILDEFQRVNHPSYKQRENLERMLTIGPDSVSALLYALDFAATDDIANTIILSLDYWYSESNQLVPASINSLGLRTRLWSIDRVGKTCDHEKVPILVDWLKDPDWRVQAQATEVLSLLANRNTVPLLISKALDPDLSVRQAVNYIIDSIAIREGLPDLRELYPLTTYLADLQESFGLFPDPQDLPLLHRSLKHPERSIRRASIGLISAFKHSSSLQFLHESLKDTDESVRYIAIKAIRNFSNPESLPQLRAMLHDPVSSVREAAIEVLGDFSDETSLSEIINCIDDSSPNVRSASIKVLTKLATKKVLPKLRKVAMSKDHQNAVRQSMLEIIGRLKDKKSLPILREFLSDSDPQIRKTAIKVLGHLRDRESLPILRSMLLFKSNMAEAESSSIGRAFDQFTVQEVIQTIGLLNDIESIPLLRDRLTDREPSLRAIAAQVISDLGDKESLPYLRKRLNDSNATVRQAAVKSLSKLDDRDSLDLVRDSLTDESANVRCAAIEAATLLNDVNALKSIRKLLTDSNREVRLCAINALQIMNDRNSIPILIDRLSELDEEIRTRSSQALIALVDQTALPQLRQRLVDTRPHVRKSIVDILKQVEDKEVVTILESQIENADSDVRRNTIEAIGMLGNVSMVPKLLPFLDEPDSSIQEAAIETLGMIANRDILPDLLNRLVNPNKRIRIAILKAINKLGDMGSVLSVRLLLNDEDNDVRRTAFEVLLRLEGREHELLSKGEGE